MPPVEEGTYYVIVRTDAQNRIRESNEGNNVSTSAAITTVSITELQNQPAVQHDSGKWATKLLKYMPPPIETLKVTLTTDLPQRQTSFH